MNSAEVVSGDLSTTDSSILELSSKRIDFQPVSKDVNVFYDECNRQVFIVINRGTEGIIVKGSDDLTLKFNLQNRGSILSIKFSPTFEILSLQRSSNYMEFVIFKNGQPVDLFNYTLKNKNSRILFFIWTNANEIVLVLNCGIEYFQVIPDKKNLKCLKTFNLTVDWFVYQHVSCILLVANGTFGNVIHPFLFRPSNVYKLNRFEIDWTNHAKTSNIALRERDVTITNLYGKPRLLILRHQPILKEQSGAHILVYTFHNRDSIPQKTDILITYLSGKFAINIVDDLIVVHHQTSKSSIIFDINLPPNEIHGNTKYHVPIISKCVIKPYKINNLIDYQLYSTNWAIFQPNIIIDAKYGCLWLLQLNLLNIYGLIKNVPILIDFLLLRKNSKSIILKVCRNVVKMSKEHNQNPIGNLSLLFNKLNLAYKESTSENNQSALQADSFDYLRHKIAVTIDQRDMLTHFFEFFEEDKITKNLGIAIIFEYITSLSSHKITIQYFIYEFLINHLISSKNFYQMHQFLQYHVFSDSKHLACLLLSLNGQYSYAVQLGLDMLKRIGSGEEEIIEVLLSQNQVTRALHYINKYHNINSISARKFLEVAYNTNDPRIFQQVYKQLQLRNLALRGSYEFVKGENCEPYVILFENLFGTKMSFIA
ncbi:hypothetical protein BLOT_011100 [Blomia tropicalis]|nr:hypothetical protein BLOT_011100 [Blomia tropicalis]